MMAVLCLQFELFPMNKFVVDIIYSWLSACTAYSNCRSGDWSSLLMDIFVIVKFYALHRFNVNVQTKLKNY